MDELYSNAYIYTLPSDLEGMPLSLLEAMSYGNCCLVSDIPECAEVVEDKALIFQKSNVEDLQEKLQDACDHPEMVMKMKNQATDFICAKYNWDICSSMAEGLCRSVVEAMGRGCGVICTRVCGNVELADKEFLYEKKDFGTFMANALSFLCGLCINLTITQDDPFVFLFIIYCNPTNPTVSTRKSTC